MYSLAFIFISVVMLVHILLVVFTVVPPSVHAECYNPVQVLTYFRSNDFWWLYTLVVEFIHLRCLWQNFSDYTRYMFQCRDQIYGFALAKQLLLSLNFSPSKFHLVGCTNVYSTLPTSLNPGSEGTNQDNVMDFLRRDLK